MIRVALNDQSGGDASAFSCWSASATVIKAMTSTKKAGMAIFRFIFTLLTASCYHDGFDISQNRHDYITPAKKMLGCFLLSLPSLGALG
jgi:hypothetical protein